MSTLSYSPGRNCVNSLGIPVDNLDLKGAVERIIAMAKDRESPPSLVSTLNVDFLVNSLGTLFNKPRHPELLEVLRGSDMVTADGFPILWLSRLLGRPLPERVCGSDMLPAIAERAAQEGLSLFLLGGAEGLAEQAASTLIERFPELRIAGTAAPFVHTAGPGLAQASCEDEALLRQIHDSNADILLVGLGNPKQELWFNRNRSRLRTPVSIGVGGSFSFVTGSIQRAPEFWRKHNLEWIHRACQEPRRLVGRYAHGLVKLALLATPVLWSKLEETVAAALHTRSPGKVSSQRLWSSRGQSISIIALPNLLDCRALTRVLTDLSQGGISGELTLVDFSSVEHIALNAQQELFNLAALLRQQPTKIQLIGISSGLSRKLAGARLLDLFEDNSGSIERIARREDHHQEFFCESYALEDATYILLGGRICRDSLQKIGFVECLLESGKHRDCILDFRNVSLLESSGISELLPLLTKDSSDSSSTLLSGACYRTEQMFRVAEVVLSATVIDDVELLQRLRGER